MAFQPTQDGAAVRLVFAKGVITWTNTLWFSRTNFVQDDLQELADLVGAGGIGQFIVYMADGVELMDVIATDMRTQDGSFATAATTTANGDASTDMLPPSVALVSTFNTVKRGRSYRGRNYWSGIAEEHWNGEVISTVVTAACLTFLEGLQSAAALASWTLGVRSGQLNGVLRSTALIEPVTNITIRSARAGSQRRRNRRP